MDSPTQEQTEPRERGRRTWRSALAIVAVIAYAVVFLPVAWFVIGLGGWFWSARSTVVAVVVLASPMAALAIFVCRRFRLLAVVAIVVGLVGPIFMAVHFRDSSAPPTDYLAERLDEVGTPSGWGMLEERRYGGNCFDVCPNVCRFYRTPDAPTLAAVDRAFERFTSVGFRPVDVLSASETWPWRYARAPHLYLTVTIDRWSPVRSASIEQAVSVCLSGNESPKV